MSEPLEDDLVNEVRAYVTGLLPMVTELRHALHREPEVGLRTPATRAAVAAALRRAPLKVWEPLLETDLIAELPGATRRTICLRADMDGLPIAESTGVPYQSSRTGRMHACGHDGHTAILVGAALTLTHFRARLPVTVRFIFQPGEEMVCGGNRLVAAGACEGAAAAYALHGWPGLAAGSLSSRRGPLFAAGGFFKIEVRGKGCHGAQPEAGRNPIPCAAAIVARLQSLHDRVRAAEGAIVSVCAVQAGEGANTIPPVALIKGTVRHLEAATGERIEAEVRAIAAAEAARAQVDVHVEYERPYCLPVSNSDEGFERVRSAAQRGLPAGAWHELEQPSMGNEDFAFYLAGRDGAMFLLGLGENAPGLHTPAFDFNDQALAPGILTFALLALGYGE